MDVEEAFLLTKVRLCSKMKNIHWRKCAWRRTRGDLWGWFQVMFVEIPGYGEFKENGVSDLRAKGGNTTGC